MKKHLLIIILVGLISCEPIFSQNIQSPTSVLNDSLISYYTEQVNPDSIESYISMLENIGTRFMIAPNRKMIAEIVQNKFYSLGINIVRIDSFLCTTYIDLWNLHYDTTTWQYNVIATIPGISNSNKYYVIGAHYDDVVAPAGDPMVFAPGADDNASGVAALFEVARIFQGNEYLPINTIELVAFAAEELMYYGNAGSEKYVEKSIEDGMDILMMINNDMIGYTNVPPWKIRISNYVGSENLTWISEYVTESFTEISPVKLAASNEGEADCTYFVAAGIPSVYFFEKDFNPYYHTVSDIVNNCNIDYCAEAIKISVGVLVGIDDPTVDINESRRSLPFKIYPNPSSGILTIQFAKKNIDEKLIEYSIFDLTGRKVSSDVLISNVTNKLNVSELESGIYILELTSDEETYSARLIIQ